MNSAATSTSRKETERMKLIQEKCQTLLTQMLRDEDNKYCVDCDAKGPRWASWNLGVFLCIRCAGIHRNLGVHISRVKSVNLDTWTPEQVISLQQMGNSRARAVYEAQLPDGFRRPQTDTALESFIRAKYEHKKYIAREWVPPSPPKVDWAKEIDEELERQKRKKKAAQANSSLGIGVISGGATSGANVCSDKKSGTSSNVRSTPLPAPLPKPKPGQSGSSPKTQRTSTSASSNDNNQTNDLLGLSSPTKPVAGNTNANDSFTGFLSAATTPVVDSSSKNEAHSQTTSHSSSSSSSGVGINQQSSLAKEEEDFFNQGSLNGNNEKDKSGKLTKDSILALYGSAPPNNPLIGPHNPHNPQFGQPQHPMFVPAYGGGGLAPIVGVGGAGGVGGFHPTQFMTPPNSTSMYNAPVMTAPAAFTAAAGMQSYNQYTGIPGASYGHPINLLPTTGSGIMSTGQPPLPQQQTIMSNNLNLLQSNNQSLMAASGSLGGMSAAPAVVPGTSIGSFGLAGNSAMFPMQMTGGVGGVSINNTQPSASGNFQASSNASATANLNQQFGNLNIGNVWQ